MFLFYVILMRSSVVHSKNNLWLETKIPKLNLQQKELAFIKYFNPTSAGGAAKSMCSTGLYGFREFSEI